MTKTDKPEYTLEELAKHHETAPTQWLLIDNKVIDITEFKTSHPGGEDILLEHAGRDATEEFKNVGHSASAADELDTLCVGYIHQKKDDSENTSDKANVDGNCCSM